MNALVPVELPITQFADQVRIKLINNISIVFQKLLKSFNSTAILTSFFNIIRVFSVAFVLDLNDSESIITGLSVLPGSSLKYCQKLLDVFE